ncbi:MAG TPA: superinfection immunity protein [Candidatus Acidoferrum sp.]|nr:superinfection immunity protein [Candidatus Acidoferrum sp.]
MTLLLLGTLLYFLPTIIAHNKRDFVGIFVVNLLFGWTIIGWIIAMIWACASEVKPHVLVVAGPAGVARYCCRCGTMSVTGGRFCGTCGAPL